MPNHRYPFIFEESRAPLNRIEATRANVIIIGGYVFTDLDATSARQVIQEADFTPYLGVYANSRVVRYPELRNLLNGPVSKYWETLTGIAWAARDHGAMSAEHVGHAFEFYQDVTHTNGDIEPRYFDRDLFKNWRTLWPTFMTPKQPHVAPYASAPRHVQRAVDEILKEAQLLIAHHIIQAVTPPNNAPTYALQHDVNRLAYRPVEDTDLSALVESAAAQLSGHMESQHHIDRTFANLNQELRDIASLHKPGTCDCETGQCPILIPTQMVHDRIKMAD